MTASYASPYGDNTPPAAWNTTAAPKARKPKFVKKGQPLVLEGALGFYNEDHYVCDGDIFIDEDTSLTQAIIDRFVPGLSHEHMGRMGSCENYGRVRITIEAVQS